LMCRRSRAMGVVFDYHRGTGGRGRSDAAGDRIGSARDGLRGVGVVGGDGGIAVGVVGGCAGGEA